MIRPKRFRQKSILRLSYHKREGDAMIRKIVLFTKGIETLWYFSEQMGKTFEKLGYEVFYFDQCAQYDSLSRLLWFAEPKVTAAISFNFDGCSGEDYLIDSKGINFFEAREIPMINIVVDHPFYYHKFLPYLPKDYTQISIDRHHEAYLKRFFPDIKRGPFLPLAGTSLWTKETLPSWDERPFDIVFTGNYTPPSDFDGVLDRVNEEYSSFYRGIIQDFVEHPHMPMEEGIIKHIQNEIEDVDEDGLRDTMPNMIMIDLYVRHYFRGEVIKTLVDSGLKVHCFGAGWERLECKHPENIINGKLLDSLGCLQQISKAKVSLNVMPWFKDGAHDRVFNSMLNGAVCLTDWSDYMTKVLKRDKDVIFYELDELNALPSRIRELLNNREQWEHLQKNAFETASAAHTWEHRVKRIHKEILCKIL